MLLDSNIIIIASKLTHTALISKLKSLENNLAVSHISVIEVLGYHRLKSVERQYLERFFASVRTLPVSEAIVEKAVEIRRNKPVPLADAVIAATALVHGLALLTENVKDYAHIKDLEVLTVEELIGRA